MRNHVSFRQYNPDKPAKYGVLFKSLIDARDSYTERSLVYAGKPTELPSPYYVSGTENYIKELVTKLGQAVVLQGRNISMDRLYASVSVAKWLLTEKMTCIGTMLSRRVGILEEVKTTKGRKEFSTKMFWEKEKGDLVLTSYVVRSSNGLKNVLLLSTVQPLKGCTRDDRKKKPSILKLYDFTKGGTDVMDQRIGTYSTKMKSRKWTKVSLSYVLDTCRVNASTVYALSKGDDPKKTGSFDFGWDLAESLVLLLDQGH